MASSIPTREAGVSIHSSSRAWETLKPPLAEWIIEALTSMGMKRMTPVQASTIPLFMAHKDVVVEAVTGSGKTLAFLIPLVERLLRLEEPLKKHHVGAIIISPTRELTTQIYGVLQSLLAFHPPSASAIHDQTEVLDEAGPRSNLAQAPVLNSSGRMVVTQLLVGGDTTPAQNLSCFLKRSPNLLISTPGRLLELLSSPHVHCPQSSFEVLVMDEADRLLDLGFKEDLQKILGRLPKQRRTGLFSASMSEAVDQLIRVGLRNPVKVAVKVKSITGGEDRRTPSSLQMNYIVAPASQKLPSIGRILSSLKPLPTKTIIYLSTCAAVDYFQHIIPPILPLSEGQPYDLFPLHGKYPARVREKNFAAFTNSIKPAILLTTDVAARGLDIPQVDLVVQIDPPIDPKVFLHRCGRAGRAGRRGMSVILLQPGREEDYLRFLDVRKTPLTPLSLSNMEIRPEEVQAATTTIRGIVLSDRALHDKAQRGFVSWVKAYSKHQASSIFRVTDLDWEDLGRAWGLLKLPKMPELKNWHGDKRLGLDIDFSSYAYKDKQREQRRRQELEAYRHAQDKINNSTTNIQPPFPSSSSSSSLPFLKRPLKRAWSDKLDQQAVREKRREKKGLAREHRLWAAMTPAEQEKKRELERMIEQVKRDRVKGEAEGEFEGFGD